MTNGLNFVVRISTFALCAASVVMTGSTEDDDTEAVNGGPKVRRVPVEM